LSNPTPGIEIIGTGSYGPENIVTNDDLVELGVDTTDDWVVSRTGIKERRLAADDQAASNLASEAARNALQDAGLDATDIDAIFVATCTPDMWFPSTACFVQDQIGASNAFCMDLSAACSGFVYGMEMVRHWLAGNPGKTVLLIGAEKTSSVVDWTDRTTCVLFGDGAGAVVVRGGGDRRGVLACRLGSEGGLADLLMIPGGGSRAPITKDTVGTQVIKMSGREVFRHAVTKMANLTDNLIAEAGLKPDDIALVIPHQANMRIIAAIQDKLQLPDEKMYANVDRFGNTSAASVPIAMDEAARAGRLQPGDLVLLVAFGAGFTWGGCIFEWSKDAPA